MEASVAIVGGFSAAHSRYPWYCSLYTMKGSVPKADEFFCGGVLIHPRVVLTAYHCVKDGLPSHVLVGGNELHKVVLSTLQPIAGVTFNLRNDMAVLYLATPSRYPPIKLAQRMPASGTVLTIMGKGVTQLSPLVFPKVLTKAFLGFVDNRVAIAALSRARLEPPSPDKNKEWSKTIDLGISLLRFAENAAGVSYSASNCFGDSGGPVIIDKGLGQDELLGIITASPLCNPVNKMKVSIFSAVPPRLPLLMEKIRKASELK